jgi:anhydro-N-acetylmuramic acid kinase
MKLKILGVMTGTATDGLDAACLEFAPDGSSKELWSASKPFPRELRKTILEIQTPKDEKPHFKFLTLLDLKLGRWYGSTLNKLIQAQPSRLKPDLIATHGQTVLHEPHNGLSIQIGNPFAIASITDITVASQFRQGDVIAGGQGAPLASAFHKFLAGSKNKTQRGIAIHNLGGFSNLTYMSPKGKVLSFDTGPANALIDAAVFEFTEGKKRYDEKGALAKRGKTDPAILKKLLQHRFLKKIPPKSTGRDDFTIPWFLSHFSKGDLDMVRTATEFTVESIARAYEKWVLPDYPLEVIYLCGGGEKNNFLKTRLKHRLPSVRIESTVALGVDPQKMEAYAFSYLGFLSLKGEMLGGEWTGVKGFGPPAQFVPGKNWKNLLTRVNNHFMKMNPRTLR